MRLSPSGPSLMRLRPIRSEPSLSSIGAQFSRVQCSQPACRSRLLPSVPGSDLRSGLPPRPWRDSSPWLWLLSGVLFLVFAALCSFGVGGYAAGACAARTQWQQSPESAFRDGMHGLYMWGLAQFIQRRARALVGADLGAKSAAPSGGTAGPAAPLRAETILAANSINSSAAIGTPPTPASDNLRAESRAACSKARATKAYRKTTAPTFEHCRDASRCEQYRSR